MVEVVPTVPPSKPDSASVTLPSPVCVTDLIANRASAITEYENENRHEGTRLSTQAPAMKDDLTTA